MASILDSLFSPGGDGLLSFFRNNALNQQFPSGPASDQAQYGPTPMPQMAQQAPVPQNPPPVIRAQPMQQAPQMAPQAPQMVPQAAPQMAPQMPTALSNPLSSLGNFFTGITPQGQALRQQSQVANVTARALIAKGIDPQIAVAAVQPGNTEILKQLVDQNFGPHKYQNIGEGHVMDERGNVTQAYEPEDKTPQSVLEYQYYLKNVPHGQQPMDYATFSTAKARAGATNINNSVDMGNGPTYDKQLVEGLGKAHAALSNGVEDAQSRARDIAAMQGALDAIQKNGGTTGGLGQDKILQLKKTINEGATALGFENPFAEGDISDKEFLTKFNRGLAGAMAKSNVGGRVTNFEMGNYLKANPGLDMSLTGNQRLLGIQAQIEQRNIAVGNAIRQATAQAIAGGKTVNPVDVQKIITDYDGAHHIKDPITGQDLTQSYTLPEFQNQNPTNKSMADTHAQNLSRMEKTVGGKTYHTPDGGKTWFVD